MQQNSLEYGFDHHEFGFLEFRFSVAHCGDILKLSMQNNKAHKLSLDFIHLVIIFVYTLYKYVHED